MDDDFDLFPKRENLDPFSFGKQDKKPEKELEAVDLFGLDEEASREPPSAPEGPEEGFTPEEEKTFDEPVGDVEETREPLAKGRKKHSSPFVLIGGALIIILGLLYLALTFLIPGAPPTPSLAPPPVAVEVKPPPVPAPAPAPEPEQAVSPETVEAAAEPAAPAAASVPPSAPKTASTDVPETASPAADSTEPPAPKEPEKPSAATPVPVAAAPQVEKGGYAVQLGALILEPSVKELEKQVAGLGYETYRETGSTTRMMNIVTAGPFKNMEEGEKALTRIRDAGIESTITRRSSGDVVVNAGSYLLEKNASLISKKIQDLGFPVLRNRKDVRLPVIFVRTGHFQEADEAAHFRDQLKEKGLDAIVVEVR